jgi:hypothetical protein
MGTYRIENWPSPPATLAPELQKEFAAHAGDGRASDEHRTRSRFRAFDPKVRTGCAFMSIQLCRSALRSANAGQG